MTSKNSTQPRIYVACLASYNNGNLYGRWIDADQDADTIREEIADMLKQSPEPNAEEWAIHDYEGFGEVKLSESEDLDSLAELAELLDEHGEVFAALVSHEGGLRYLDRAKEIMEDGYHGEWDSLADYAENYLDDTGMLNDLPENLRCYFDYEKFADDLELGGDVFTLDLGGKVHVFDNNV